MARETYGSIDEFIAANEAGVQPILNQLRDFIKNLAPNATERITWSMPTFYLNGNLVHFMAHKKHIGFYPGASGVEHFKSELDTRGLKYTKGAIQFPIDEPLHWDLIETIVNFRIAENTKSK